MVQRQDIEFTVEGDVTVRGWLFVPDGPGPHPGYHHGARVRRSEGTWARSGLPACSPTRASWCWCMTIAASAPATARLALMSTRGSRSPTGDGRSPSSKASLPSIPMRIGLWGTSYAGGHAIVLGATDRRLRAVVAQVPTISGYEQSLRRVAPDQVPALEAVFIDDERRQFHGEPPRHPGGRQLRSRDSAPPTAPRTPSPSTTSPCPRACGTTS